MVFRSNIFASRLAAFFLALVVLILNLSLQSAQESQDSQTKEMRQMWRNIVNRRPRRQVKIARPAGSNSKIGETNQDKREETPSVESGTLEEEPKPIYRLSSPMLPSQGQDIGITVWRLRPSRPTDARLARQRINTKRLKHNYDGRPTGSITYLTAERVGTETPLRAGEMLQLSVEVPQGGFLYVIDREQYSEAGKVTYGKPYLIFPTSHTNEGLNRLEPGVLLNIPEMTDDPPFFDLERTMPNHVGEEITFVVSPTSVSELSGHDEQTVLSEEMFGRLQQWAAQTGRIDLVGGVSEAQTIDEAVAAQSSAADGSKRLKHNSPLPQMIFRSGRKAGEPFIVNIVLKIAP